MADIRSGRSRGPGRAPAGDPRTGPTTHADGASMPGRSDAAGGAGSRAAPPRPTGPPRWLQYTTLVLSLAGLGMSIYLTVEHFLAGSSLACPETGVVNCAKVTTSPQSVIFGIPVPVLGLLFFAWMIVINSPPAWRSPRPEVRLARVLSAIAGIAFVLYLVYAELVLIGNICLECTTVHVITFALFVLIVFSATGTGRAPARRH
jgi:uncharacterized membrane protein